MREKSLELAIELCGEGLVVAQDQRRALQFLDDVGHGERLAGACHAQEGDGVHALPEGGTETVDGCRLVAGGFVCGFKLEFHAVIIFPRQRYAISDNSVSRWT